MPNRSQFVHVSVGLEIKTTTLIFTSIYTYIPTLAWQINSDVVTINAIKICCKCMPQMNNYLF